MRAVICNDMTLHGICYFLMEIFFSSVKIFVRYVSKHEFYLWYK